MALCREVVVCVAGGPSPPSPAARCLERCEPSLRSQLSLGLLAPPNVAESVSEACVGAVEGVTTKGDRYNLIYLGGPIQVGG